MAKIKAGSPANPAKNAEPLPREAMTLSDLRADSDLWYKIHVLLYDLYNIAKDRAAEARTLCTTDELYISAPYFTPEEAALIKATVVPPPTLNYLPEFQALDFEDDTSTKIKEPMEEKAIPEAMTIEEAIKSCLQNFFKKRRASGDARPCGPHDMSPIYNTVFGITKEELTEEKFLSRLRRAGLGRPNEKTLSEDSNRKE
jgi:hypothetical protein